MKEEKVLAYHFTDGMKLRDGQELVEGKTYIHDGPIEICRAGLHASRRVIDAMHYAPNGTLSIVECSEIVKEHSDKFVCRARKVLETHDVTRVLQEFALDVAEETVRKYYNIEEDTRSLDAIRIAKSFLDGKATLSDLEEARVGYFHSVAHHNTTRAYNTNASNIAYRAVYYACKYGKSMSENNSLLTQRLQKVFKTSLDF